MNLLDAVLLGVLALSTLAGVLRGLARELLSLLGWAVGVVVAARYSTLLSDLFASPLEQIGLNYGPLRVVAAGVAIMFVVLVIAAMLGRVLSHLLAAVKLSGVNRALGALFGLARGLLMLFIFVFFIGQTAVSQWQSWRDSFVIALGEAAVRFTMPTSSKDSAMPLKVPLKPHVETH